MKSFVALAIATSALALPAPQSSAPEGCTASRDGTFTISVVNVTNTPKRSIEKRQLDGILTLTLKDGILTDQANRIGSVVANHQFQFDNPVQVDALKTSGFSVCENGSLALDGSAIWYQCLSGNFHNLYDEWQGGQCNQIYLVAGGTGAVSQAPDGQPAATTAAQISQISDGQPQAPTGPVTAPYGPVVSQISDGQPQAPTGQPPTVAPAPGPVVSQISDGQPQAPTAAPAPSGPVISQISDGQPQVPPATTVPAATTALPVPAPITQISDGQPQAPVATGNATTPNATSPPLPEFTGAAATPMVGVGAFAAGLVALAAML